VIRIEVFNNDVDLQAGGLTPNRHGLQIQEAVVQYLKNPDVTVIVLRVNSRTYTMKPVRVFEALNMAGAFMEFANKSKIIVARGDESKAEHRSADPLWRTHFACRVHTRVNASNRSRHLGLLLDQGYSSALCTNPALSGLFLI